MLEETKLIVPRSEYLGMPQFCASCLSTDNLEYKSVRSARSLWFDSFEVSVPSCARCAHRSRWWSHPVGRAVLLAPVVALGIADNHLHLPAL